MSLGEASALSGQVRAIGIDFGSGAVLPGTEEIAAGKYDKLARTVYLYVGSAALAKASADDIAYVQTLVKDTDKFVRFANLVPLRPLQYQENVKRLAAAK
jgi:ABC-type phosphate transport system substrate-binding protein